MEYVFELVPFKKEDIIEIVTNSKDFFDYYTLPEGPGGYPGLSSIAVSTYLKAVYDVESIPHVRLYDINRLALLSIANTVKEFGLRGLLLLRGDRPVEGMIVNDIGSEEALTLLRKKGYSFPIGLLLSLNFSLERILERISVKADFYYVLNYSDSKCDVLREISRSARSNNSRLYVFILLGVGKNIKLFKKLHQPFVYPEELKETLLKLKEIVDGIILSSPLEPLNGINILIKNAI
ncbi:MAG: 5,10-methylenetetrahydrofolate reductase [Staphylothermus sp.]|nr:5,10-methylenetetrahydrofolate reductase [Staphylothermus sp.]